MDDAEVQEREQGQALEWLRGCPEKGSLQAYRRGTRDRPCQEVILLVLFFLKGLDTLSDEEKKVADFVVSQGGLVVSLVLPNKAKTTKDNVLMTYNLINAITRSTYFAEFYYKRRKIRAIDEDLLNLSLNSGNEVLVAPRPAIFKRSEEFIGDDSNELIRNGATIVYDLKSLNESVILKD